MRDYLYAWHQPNSRRLVLSGVEFRDVAPELTAGGGVVLLRHRFDVASFDPTSRFEYAAGEDLSLLVREDVYSYGDFCWADIGADASLAQLSDQAIAELTFFAQLARPLVSPEIPGLGNRFLWWTHDDGWYARVFYREWRDVAGLLARLLKNLLADDLASETLKRVSRGETAWWCRRDAVAECEATEDIDALRRRH